jgi:hypothetical protein
MRVAHLAGQAAGRDVIIGATALETPRTFIQAYKVHF